LRILQTNIFRKLYTYTQNDIDLMRFCVQSYAPGFSTVSNTYEYLKLFRVASGSGLWNINGSDYYIKLGDILMLNNTEPRALRNVDGPEMLTLEYCTWLPVAVQCSTECLGVYFDRPPEFRNLLPSSNPMHSDIHHLFDMLNGYAQSDISLRSDLMQQLLRTLFILASQAWKTEFPNAEQSFISSNVDYEVITRAVHYITSHPAEDLSESALAAQAYMSKNRFIRLFRAFNGMTPAEYVRTFRVRHAMERIKSGSVSITAAAMESGFGSMSGFYKAVSAVTGSTPGGKGSSSNTGNDA